MRLHAGQNGKKSIPRNLIRFFLYLFEYFNFHFTIIISLSPSIHLLLIITFVSFSVFFICLSSISSPIGSSFSSSFYLVQLLLFISRHHFLSFKDLSFEAEFTIVAKRNDFCHAFVAYFECGFTQVKTEKNQFQGIFHNFSCIYLNISIFILLLPSLSHSINLLHIIPFVSLTVFNICLSSISSSLCSLLLSRLSPSLLFLSFSMLFTHIDGRALSLPWRDAQRIILLWNSKHKNHHTGNNTGSD